MKKYVLLTISGFMGFTLLSFFYVKSKSLLSRNHQAVLELLNELKQTEVSLEKDVLRARSFLLMNYDSIVHSERILLEACERLTDKSLAERFQSQDLKTLVENYCSDLHEKLLSVESFKSTNAILKNSLYSVRRISDEILPSDTKQQSLVHASLSYYSTASPESKQLLERNLKESKPGSPLVSHAQRVLEKREELDTLLNEIIPPEGAASRLDQIRLTYLDQYKRAESMATVYRNLLFASCMLLLGFTLFGVIRLWHAAHQLAYANANLENRVAQRTSELQSVQQTVLEQQQALISSAKMSALGEMAGGVAHEINTPLAIISMRIEQIEECVQENDFSAMDVLETLGVVRRTAERIAKIVNGLRFFARDGRRAAPQDTSVDSIIEETLSLCQERFSNHGVQLEYPQHKSLESLRIHCRSVEISQVLLNLLNNAYDAIQPLPQKWIRIDVEDLDEYVQISVTDSGSGIPMEIRDKLTQPFFTTKELGKGTGLGLSISRGIVESHHGHFYLDTQSPHTRFVAQVPKKAQVETKLRGA
ncbi:MAG: DAHL domain-containing protein [Bdellovibrionales bacterium]